MHSFGDKIYIPTKTFLFVRLSVRYSLASAVFALECYQNLDTRSCCWVIQVFIGNKINIINNCQQHKVKLSSVYISDRSHFRVDDSRVYPNDRSRVRGSHESGRLHSNDGCKGNHPNTCNSIYNRPVQRWHAWIAFAKRVTVRRSSLNLFVPIQWSLILSLVGQSACILTFKKLQQNLFCD